MPSYHFRGGVNGSLFLHNTAFTHLSYHADFHPPPRPLGRRPRGHQFAASDARARRRRHRRHASAHLRVHLQDDSRRKLCSAGGWTAKTSTAEEYAGLTIEATRHWSRLMVRPVTLL